MKYKKMWDYMMSQSKKIELSLDKIVSIIYTLSVTPLL